MADKYVPHLRRAPPQAFRRSKAQEGVTRMRRYKSAPSTRDPRSSEGQALRDQVEREKMLDDYFDCVRQSTTQVKNRLSELEISLGVSESDSVLAGVRAPHFENLGISFNGPDLSGKDSQDGNFPSETHAHEENISNPESFDGEDHDMTNADMIVHNLEQASKWLNEAKSRGLDNVAKGLEEDASEYSEEKDIKAPEELFGSELNKRRLDELLAKCEEVKSVFLRNVGYLLDMEKQRMEKVVETADEKAFLMDQECESAREDILRVDRSLSKYNLANMKIKAMIEDRMMPTIRQLQDLVIRQDASIKRAKEDMQAEESYHERAKYIQDQLESQKNLDHASQDLLTKATILVQDFLDDIVAKEKREKEELLVKIRANDLQVADARKQKKTNQEALQRAEELGILATTELANIRMQIVQEKEPKRQEAVMMQDALKRVQKDCEGWEEILEEFHRVRRRKTIEASQAAREANMAKKRKKRTVPKVDKNAQALKANNRALPADGLSSVQARGIGDSSNEVHVTIEDALKHCQEDSDMENNRCRGRVQSFEGMGSGITSVEKNKLRSFQEAKYEANASADATLKEFDVETGGVLGIMHNEKAREARKYMMIYDKETSEEGSRKDTYHNHGDLLFRTVLRPPKSLITASCYMDKCGLVALNRFRPDPREKATKAALASAMRVGDVDEQGDSDEPPTEEARLAKAMKEYDSEALSLFDLEQGLHVLGDCIVSLCSNDLVDPEKAESFTPQMEAYSRELRMVSTASRYRRKGSSHPTPCGNLEQSIHQLCLDVIASVYSFSPRTLLLRNERHLLATALQSVLALLGIVQHCSREDCLSKIEINPFFSMDNESMEDCAWGLVELVTFGTTDKVESSENVDHRTSSASTSRSTKSRSPSPTRSVSKKDKSKLKKGNKPQKMKKKKPHVVLSARVMQPSKPFDSDSFVNAALEFCTAIPGADLLQSKSNGALQEMMRTLWSMSRAAHGESENGSFTVAHRRCLLGCIVYLACAANIKPLSKTECMKMLEETLKCETAVDYTGLLSSPRSFAGQILKTVSPQIVPGILALDLFQRLIGEEIGRKDFIRRIAQRDDDVAELQFLNVFLSPAADAEVNAQAAANLRDRAMSGDLKLTSDEQRSIVMRLQASRHAWLDAMQTYIEKMCNKITDMVWRARLAGKGEVLIDESIFPLHPSLQEKVLDHVNALKSLALSRSENGDAMARGMESTLKECVKGVFASIEQLMSTTSFLEGPLRRRVHYIQKQNVLLQKRAIDAESDLKARTYVYDVLKGRDELMKVGMSNYGEGPDKSLFISAELRKILEDPDGDGLQPILEAGRAQRKALIMELDKLKQDLVRLRKKTSAAKPKTVRKSMMAYSSTKHMHLATVAKAVKNLLGGQISASLMQQRQAVTRKEEVEMAVPPAILESTEYNVVEDHDEDEGSNSIHMPQYDQNRLSRVSQSSLDEDAAEYAEAQAHCHRRVQGFHSDEPVAVGASSLDELKPSGAQSKQIADQESANSIAMDINHMTSRERQETLAKLRLDSRFLEKARMPTGWESDRFDFAKFGPRVLFVNEVYTFPIAENLGITPLVKQYVLIDRGVARDLQRYLEAKERREKLRAGLNERPYHLESDRKRDLEARANAEVFLSGASAGSPVRSGAEETQHRSDGTPLDTSTPSSKIVKIRLPDSVVKQSESETIMQESRHGTTTVKRHLKKNSTSPTSESSKTTSNLGVLHPAIQCILQRAPITGKSAPTIEEAGLDEGERAKIRRRARAHRNAAGFIRGDDNRIKGGVRAWLYDLDFKLPTQLLYSERDGTEDEYRKHSNEEPVNEEEGTLKGSNPSDETFAEAEAEAEAEATFEELFLDEEDYEDLKRDDEEEEDISDFVPTFEKEGDSTNVSELPKEIASSVNRALDKSRNGDMVDNVRLNVDYVSLAAILQTTLTRELNAKHGQLLRGDADAFNTSTNGVIPLSGTISKLSTMDTKPTVKAILYKEASGQDIKVLKEHHKLENELAAAFAEQCRESQQERNRPEHLASESTNDDHYELTTENNKENKTKKDKTGPLALLGSTQPYYRRLERLSETDLDVHLSVDGPSPIPPRERQPQ